MNQTKPASTLLSVNSSTQETFDALLKKPGVLRLAIVSDGSKRKLYLRLLALVVLGAVLFGLTLGGFTFSIQLLAVPLKLVLGLGMSALICLPSLYVFSALTGTQLTLPQIALSLVTALSLTSALLLGFAPVLWVFSRSTDSVGFFGTLTLVAWLISLGFGLRLLTRILGSEEEKLRAPMKVWMAIFLFVTLQMSTALRPLISEPDQHFNSEKLFFTEHWANQMFSFENSTLETEAGR